MRRTVGLSALVAAAIAAAIGLVVVAKKSSQGEARCGDGFVARQARCIPSGCPPPLVLGPDGCDAPATRVAIPATRLQLGPSDWEAQGRVRARVIETRPFAIDAFEVTVARWRGKAAEDPDRFRAQSGISYAEAERHCAARGGRLPTEDEWIAAAAGERATRYPWGDTGAVCRRAAWALVDGPCATGADSPDTVGAHASGANARGIHDLAGNVAEWVAASPDATVAIVKGGSWRTSLAADLRTWAARELPKETRADDIGVRCAYE